LRASPRGATSGAAPARASRSRGRAPRDRAGSCAAARRSSRPGQRSMWSRRRPFAYYQAASKHEAGASELDDDLGAAERRALDGERTAVKLHGFAHDREPDALPGRRLVRAYAALHEPLHLLGRDSRAVVADPQHEPIGPSLDDERNFRTSILVRVVEQIAEQLREVAGIPVEDGAGHDPRRELDALLAIDLV